MKTSPAFVGIIVSLLPTAMVWGATPAEVAQLGGKEMTSVGAERAGNARGTIPAFQGSEKPLPGWKWGKYRIKYWQYKNEKPLFTIDASNVDKYAKNLSPGQIQMLRQLKGYTMPVYSTHRDCGFPNFVKQNTKETALKSEIGSNGWSLKYAILPSVPFPIPTSGIQVVWNWLVRYQGLGMDWTHGGWTLLSNSPGNDDHVYGEYSQIMYYPWAAPGQHTPQENDGVLTAWLYKYMTPPSLAGQALLQRYYFSQPNESWYYFTGQRRVRRLPAYAYDAPLIGWENQYPADTSFSFIGNPDRFNWTIVGKMDLYIPYNNFQMQQFNYKIKDALLPQYVNPALRRYELHRVWVVKGVVKPGMRDLTPVKVLYIDEDDWLLAIENEYDAKGKLWRSKENFSAPEWEIGTCAVNAETYTDLIDGRYILDQTVIGTGGDLKWFPPGAKNPKLTLGYYTPETLEAISER
ncbi:MAG TPA: DUF1329 domain-containing protein [Steroidobacteraceae bacterium]|nr:DUF1329 domain-containing protein [Steroidobacteraceae bacterium]